MKPLTRRQRELLDLIIEYIDEHDGLAPTHKEIAELYGSGSVGSMHRQVTVLADKGYIKVTEGKWRSIELVDKRCPHCGEVIDG